MTVFAKDIKYSSKVSEKDVKLEIELQQASSKHDFTPNIIKSTFKEDGCVIEMDHLEDVCLVEKYGEKNEDIPEWIWDEIRDILSILYDDEGIEYVDITPFNFIEKDGVVHIIDFGHAYYKKDGEMNWFLRDFFDGVNEWNPDFYEY
jgi:tRNA A-37 threonylcarbamoyl transferase component Bud32